MILEKYCKYCRKERHEKRYAVIYFGSVDDYVLECCCLDDVKEHIVTRSKNLEYVFDLKYNLANQLKFDLEFGEPNFGDENPCRFLSKEDVERLRKYHEISDKIDLLYKEIKELEDKRNEM